MYVKRVYTRSASYCRLLLLKRLDYNNWSSETVASNDDGYYAGDGRNYTGGLSHLVFDSSNTPHVIFSDIASAHWGENRSNVFNIGNIRYGVFEDGAWNITTIYRQPMPTAFYNATEMHGMCLVISDNIDTIRVIGEEMVITGENQYSRKLLSLAWVNIDSIVGNTTSNFYYALDQNYPNPFNATTIIKYQIPNLSFVSIKIYDGLGNEIITLVNEFKVPGIYEVNFDGTLLASGVYFYQLKVDKYTEIKKMILLK